ncbi:co-chaperone GroES [candidate division KSB1 bacterium]|nr:co-chaperone GroES [candidate division KSB1 bacterium]
MARKKQLIVVGDRILISPDDSKNRTEFGLYLPPGVKEKEKVRGGYVVKVGPGYPMPDPNSISEEPWSSSPKQDTKYIPLQANVGDYAIYISTAGVEIEFERKHYVVVPQSAILVLMRDDITDFDLDSDI